jgi:Uma2 family endonuclease
MTTQLARRAFSRAEYHRMAQVGILPPDDRVELIEGEVVEMSPIGSRHAACVARINAMFSRKLAKRAIVWVQNPLALGMRTEVQPDVALLRRRDDFFATQHPGPKDVLLVVEVSETSVAPDRSIKVPLYASRGVREVWLVDLKAASIEVFRQPALRQYRHCSRVGRGERLAPSAFPRSALSVSEMLGSAD